MLCQFAEYLYAEYRLFIYYDAEFHFSESCYVKHHYAECCAALKVCKARTLASWTIYEFIISVLYYVGVINTAYLT